MRPVIKDQYVEEHHIVPKCMGGTNEKDNLVSLTAAEHFVAHQLLAKIYPKVAGLWSAAILMTSHKNGKRVNNKTYAWLKVGLSRARSEEFLKTGGPTKNKKWIVCTKSQQVMLIKKDEKIPCGWVVGRNLNKDIKKSQIEEAKALKIKNIFEKNQKIANELYDLFKKFEFGSIREFSRSEQCNFSHVYVVKLWRIHLPEVAVQFCQGKSHKNKAL
jgi:hypothetical protein